MMFFNFFWFSDIYAYYVRKSLLHTYYVSVSVHHIAYVYIILLDFAKYNSFVVSNILVK